MRYFATCLAGLLCLTFMSYSQLPHFEKRTFDGSSGSLPYQVLIPDLKKKNDKYPLILFLHGAGERGSDNEVHIKHIENFIVRSQKDHPSFLLAPQCPKNEWWARHEKDGKMKSSPTSVMQLTIELLDQWLQHPNIDLNRIYITGVSMGGFGTWDLLARKPDLFAGALIVCGGGDEQTVPLISHVPQWIFHGSLDEVVRPDQSRSMVRALQKAGASPGYTEYPGVGHASWVPAYLDEYARKWLFQQTKSVSASAD